MIKIKKGDVVVRISYHKDIAFIVERVIKSSNDKSFVILKGLTERIIADSPLEDLELLEKQMIHKRIKNLEDRLENRVKSGCEKSKKWLRPFQRSLWDSNSLKEIVYTGKILHLDGDTKYSQKSAKYYRDLGLNAIVKNIPENRQVNMVQSLLERYKPDILVITGHDGMIKNNTGYNDLYNYRNSRHFINTVKEARRWDKNHKLVIFAGACQSYFEALMSAGANFASSPARVLIDFADPLIVAEKIATTDSYQYITIQDIAFELRDGTDGVGGTGATGKKEILMM